MVLLNSSVYFSSFFFYFFFFDPLVAGWWFHFHLTLIEWKKYKWMYMACNFLVLLFMCQTDIASQSGVRMEDDRMMNNNYNVIKIYVFGILFYFFLFIMQWTRLRWFVQGEKLAERRDQNYLFMLEIERSMGLISHGPSLLIEYQ